MLDALPPAPRTARALRLWSLEGGGVPSSKSPIPPPPALSLSLSLPLSERELQPRTLRGHGAQRRKLHEVAKLVENAPSRARRLPARNNNLPAARNARQMLREDDAIPAPRVPQEAASFEGNCERLDANLLGSGQGRSDHVQVLQVMQRAGGPVQRLLARAPAVVGEARVWPAHVEVNHHRRVIVVQRKVRAPLSPQAEVSAERDAGSAHGADDRRWDMRSRRDVAHCNGAARR
mmetsp:Transcript_28903/g.92475  ORF Transcript_28903/g.92475 Transcript_28903/m.92475 type:complete len:234 (-) Transcript_28903:430-1131(-)